MTNQSFLWLLLLWRVGKFCVIRPSLLWVWTKQNRADKWNGIQGPVQWRYLRTEYVISELLKFTPELPSRCTFSLKIKEKKDPFHFVKFSHTVQGVRFQGGCERNQGCKSICYVPPHLCYSIFSSWAHWNHPSMLWGPVIYSLWCSGDQAQDWPGIQLWVGGVGGAAPSIYLGRRGQIWRSRPDWDRFKQQHQQPVCVCRDPDR